MATHTISSYRVQSAVCNTYIIMITRVKQPQLEMVSTIRIH